MNIITEQGVQFLAHCIVTHIDERSKTFKKKFKKTLINVKNEALIKKRSQTLNKKRYQQYTVECNMPDTPKSKKD